MLRKEAWHGHKNYKRKNTVNVSNLGNAGSRLLRN